MSYAINRYKEALDTSPADQRLFNDYFIGTLSAKFDYMLDGREWDDALATASTLAANTIANREAA